MIKIYTLSLISLISLLSTLAFSQTKMTYKGVFETGTATYTYYENEKSDRMYDGAFAYVGNPYAVAGQFKDNQRVGLWKISALNKVYKNEKSRIQLSTGISGKFKNGMLDSIWNYSNAIKTYNPKTKKFSPKAEKTIGKAQFKNRKFTGSISYEVGITTKTSITGQFDDNGMPDGKWIKKTPKEIEEITYKNGFILSRIVKNITTGDKSVNEDFSAMYDQFWKNYDANKHFATVDGKMYFIDSFEFQNEATQLWQLDVLTINGFGSYINPFHFYKRALETPKSIQIRFIECSGNTDCYSNYMKQKNAEMEAQRQKELAEAEKIRQEALAKEEAERIAREKELERQRLEQLANAEKIGDELVSQKRYRQAIAQYSELNRMNPTQSTLDKIATCEREISRIDSLHANLKWQHEQLKAKVDPTFATAYSYESAAKAKKKVYGTNYKLCIDYLKTNFMPSFNALNIDQTPEELEMWTEKDQKAVDEIQIMSKQLDEVTNFATQVNEACIKGNKAKLRVLNSSLNPKTIIHDFVNFK